MIWKGVNDVFCRKRNDYADKKLMNKILCILQYYFLNVVFVYFLNTKKATHVNKLKEKESLQLALAISKS